jgi:hypothetical protein
MSGCTRPALIADCLRQVGGTDEDIYSAALIIARGVLEFGISSLEPKWFRQVLIGRL